MSEAKTIIYRNGCGEITEKKSRFIAHTFAISDEAEALDIIRRLRREYWDARHHCYAYVLGEDALHQRYNDDGEPSGTAGRPILDVLNGLHLCDALIVVVRYFGGTLLGTGGLVRAYQAAAREGLAQSILMERLHGSRYTVRCDYPASGKLANLLSNEAVPVSETRYTEAVEMDILLSDVQQTRIPALLTDASDGQAQIIKGEAVSFGLADGNAVILSGDTNPS